VARIMELNRRNLGFLTSPHVSPEIRVNAQKIAARLAIGEFQRDFIIAGHEEQAIFLPRGKNPLSFQWSVEIEEFVPKDWAQLVKEGLGDPEDDIRDFTPTTRPGVVGIYYQNDFGEPLTLTDGRLYVYMPGQMEEAARDEQQRDVRARKAKVSDIGARLNVEAKATVMELASEIPDGRFQRIADTAFNDFEPLRFHKPGESPFNISKLTGNDDYQAWLKHARWEQEQIKNPRPKPLGSPGP